MNEAVAYGRQFAAIYDRVYPAGPQTDQTVAWLAKLHPGGATLEFGVGTGRIALPLADRVGEVVGVDASPEMLAALRQSMADQPRAVTPVLGDIRDYADDRRYGLVYCVCGTLSMVLDPADQARAVEAAARRLAPGGLLVVETHNPVVVEQLHQGRARESFLVPYQKPGAGLLSHSTVDFDQRFWHLAHVWFDEGRSWVAQEASRLTSPEEIDGYAERAGLRLLARHGDWAGSAFHGTEPMYVSVYSGSNSADALPEA